MEPYHFNLTVLSILKMDKTVIARVAELVDALDLGSSGLWLWGFDSPLSHPLPGLSGPQAKSQRLELQEKTSHEMGNGTSEQRGT